MNKQWMLEQIAVRLAELTKTYNSYCSTATGPSKSASGAACMRSRIKKDKDALKLIRTLLEHCSDDVIITDPEQIKAFNRLGSTLYRGK